MRGGRLPLLLCAFLALARASVYNYRDYVLRPHTVSSKGKMIHGQQQLSVGSGADITFLSAFPGEREFLYPPLTFLRPTGRKEVVNIELRSTGTMVEFTVVEVEPEM